MNAAILATAHDPTRPGHDAARRIAAHDHFKVLYQRHPDDMRVNTDPVAAVADASWKEFGDQDIRYDSYSPKGEPLRFPVLMRDERIASSVELSDVLQRLPVAAVDYVFVNPTIHRAASAWLHRNRAALLQIKREES